MACAICGKVTAARFLGCPLLGGEQICHSCCFSVAAGESKMMAIRSRTGKQKEEILQTCEQHLREMMSPGLPEPSPSHYR